MADVAKAEEALAERQAEVEAAQRAAEEQAAEAKAAVEQSAADKKTPEDSDDAGACSAWPDVESCCLAASRLHSTHHVQT